MPIYKDLGLHIQRLNLHLNEILDRNLKVLLFFCAVVVLENRAAMATKRTVLIFCCSFHTI
jgi:hypothetical protein